MKFVLGALYFVFELFLSSDVKTPNSKYTGVQSTKYTVQSFILPPSSFILLLRSHVRKENYIANRLFVGQ